MNDKTAVHITKAIKNGGTKCRDEVLSPLACLCQPEGKCSRIPPLFIASGVISYFKTDTYRKPCLEYLERNCQIVTNYL